MSYEDFVEGGRRASRCLESAILALETENGRLHQRIAELEAERDQWAEWNGQACVRAEQAEDRAEKLERERDKLRELVRKAFNEGVESALDDHRRYHGGVVWPDSKSYAALAVLKDAKPTPDPGVHLYPE